MKSKGLQVGSMTLEELALKERAIREDLRKSRFKKYTGELTNTAGVKLLKKDLARVLTERRVRELAGTEKGAQA
jgi:large subunit ribosomal protein L29